MDGNRALAARAFPCFLSLHREEARTPACWYLFSPSMKCYSFLDPAKFYRPCSDLTIQRPSTCTGEPLNRALLCNTFKMFIHLLGVNSQRVW